jgi:hypothetical protein
MTDEIRTACENITRGLPATVLISVSRGAWLVPRLYIAAHGLPAADLPGLAARYGFEEGST